MTARDRTPIVHAPGVLAIPLTRGLFALIDEADAPMVAPYLWCARTIHHLTYAVRTAYAPKRHIAMHRLILDASDGTLIDHINGNGLDNRRSNLRFCTYIENNRNRRALNRDNTTGHRGVSRTKYWRWIAQANVNGKINYLGTFGTPEEASATYQRFVLLARQGIATS